MEIKRQKNYIDKTPHFRSLRVSTEGLFLMPEGRGRGSEERLGDKVSFAVH